MKTPKSLLACLILVTSLLVPACRSKGERQPTWVTTAPGDAVFAFSGSLGWALQQPSFQSTLHKVPALEQVLELFLKQARINPATESGRVSLFVLSGIKDLDLKNPNPEDLAKNVILALSDFKDPKSLMTAMAEAFPPEGSLMVKGREYPLHVILDINTWHARALLDDRGQVWLGELTTLSRLTKSSSLPKPLGAATAWLSKASAFQGFMSMDLISKQMNDLKQAIGKDRNPLALELPHGIEALAFSVSPLPGRQDAHRFELILTGTPEGIHDTGPWVNRLMGGASSLGGGAGLPAPELVQEKTRIAMRCPMTVEQIDALLNRLGSQFKPGMSPAPKTP